MSKPKFFTSYTKELEPIKSLCPEDKVERSLRDECDINRIFEHYCATNQFPVAREAKYNMLEYKEAEKIVNSVKSDFETLPSDLRAEFGSVEAYIDSMTRAVEGDEHCLIRLCDLGILQRQIEKVNTPISNDVKTPVVEAASPLPVQPSTPTVSD